MQAEPREVFPFIARKNHICALYYIDQLTGRFCVRVHKLKQRVFGTSPT